MGKIASQYCLLVSTIQRTRFSCRFGSVAWSQRIRLSSRSKRAIETNQGSSSHNGTVVDGTT